MIISHKYKYLFVELPRTGSTSIHNELLNYYSGEEILSKHATYRDFFKNANESEKEYFVFSCVRNPLDRQVSLFLKIKQGDGRYDEFRIKQPIRSLYFKRRSDFCNKENISFKNYFEKFYKIPYCDWSILDHHKFDFLIRFGNLQQDFDKLLENLGIEKKRNIPVVNKTEEKNEVYWKYYDDEIIPKTKKVFGPFMQEMGFEFPPEWGTVELSIFDWINYYFWCNVKKIFWLYFKTKH